MNKITLLLLNGLAGSAACAYASDSMASADTQGIDSRVVEEIVVTAQKRDQSLQDIPIAVSAISQDDLTSAGFNSIADLTSSAPNINVGTVGSANAILVSVRGVSNGDFEPTSNPVVGTYIDGIYVGRSTGLSSAFYDLERVEVLRGPQGTLYGRNSSGGNVNVITADPVPEFDAAVEMSYGNYDDQMVRGMVNVPLTDTLAVRVAGVMHRNDGYFETGRSTDRNYAMADDFGGRLTMLWTPNDKFSWRLSYDKLTSDGTPSYSVDTGQDGNPIDGRDVFDRPIPGDDGPMLELDNTNVRSRMTYELNDRWSLKYLAGWQNLDFTSIVSINQETYNGLSQENTRSTFHELNVTLETDRLTNITGFSYFDQTVKPKDQFKVFPFGTFFTSETLPGSKRYTEAWGVFNQFDYQIAEGLILTGGVRYSEDKARNDASQGSFCPLDVYPDLEFGMADFFGPGCDYAPSDPGADKWTSTTWRVNLSYSPTDYLMFYGGVTTGFKAGGLNPSISGYPDYRPEEITNYEAGIRYNSDDNALFIGGTFYYMDYTDIQIYQWVSIGDTDTSVITNAGGADVYGAELEARWSVSADDRLSGFVSYNNATYSEFLNAVDQQLDVVYPDISGNDLPRAPRISGRLQYERDFYLPGGGVITPMVSYYWQSKSYLRELNLPIDRVDSYGKTTVSVDYVPPDGHWKIGAYVHNLEDEEVRNFQFNGVGRYLSHYDPPRTYGVRVSYHFAD